MDAALHEGGGRFLGIKGRERFRPPAHTRTKSSRNQGKEKRKGNHFPHTHTQNLNLAQNPPRRCYDVEAEEHPGCEEQEKRRDSGDLWRRGKEGPEPLDNCGT